MPRSRGRPEAERCTPYRMAVVRQLARCGLDDVGAVRPD
jgi:hypothetical protein